MKDVVDDHWLEDVELEVALHPTGCDGGVIANHLAAHHGNGFALRRVHLARHDAAARLICRQASARTHKMGDARTGLKKKKRMGTETTCARTQQKERTCVCV